MPLLDGPTYNIVSAAFGEHFVEINYRQEEEQTDDVMTVRTILVKEETFRDRIAEIVDAFCDLVDAAEVARRNPKPTFRRPSFDSTEELDD